MNCEDFNDKLPEFLDGLLSAPEQTATREHLQQCLCCQKSWRHQAVLAKSIRLAFKQETDGLSLNPETRRNILNACNQREPRRKASDGVLAWLAAIWRRSAWTGAVLFLLLLLIFRGVLYDRPTTAPALPSATAPPRKLCVIDVPIKTKIHVSRTEKNMMVDAVIPSVMVAQATFSGEAKPSSH
jgi:anti-sigma factor RsiW